MLDVDAKTKAQEMAQVVQKLVEELQLAVDADATARDQESEACRHASTCRRRLNTAQSKMDAWYDNQRKAAPHDSDWTRSKR